MSDNMTELDAPPMAEPGAIPMTFDEAVNRFCLQQSELRSWLNQIGTDKTGSMKMDTGGHNDGQT